MFSLFIVLSNFGESLALEAKVCDQTKCLFLNNELFVVRPTLIYMNPAEI